MKKKLLLLFIMCLTMNVVARGAEAEYEVSNAMATWQVGAVVSDADVAAMGMENCFVAEPISDALFARMKKGGSWKKNTPASLRNELRYVRILHRNFKGENQLGEMVVNSAIVADVIVVFRALYEEGYKIERMQLVDDYDASDEKSMTANNSCSFNFRFKVSSTKQISLHGRGLAIDINPLYNPYVRGEVVAPAAGRPYVAKRTRRSNPYVINRYDLAHKLFKAQGFTWGGDWRTLKDYQHFEKIAK